MKLGGAHAPSAPPVPMPMKHTTTVDTLLNLEVNLTQERSPFQFGFIQDLALYPGRLSINDLGTRLSRTRQWLTSL